MLRTATKESGEPPLVEAGCAATRACSRRVRTGPDGGRRDAESQAGACRSRGSSATPVGKKDFSLFKLQHECVSAFKEGSCIVEIVFFRR